MFSDWFRKHRSKPEPEPELEPGPQVWVWKLHSPIGVRAVSRFFFKDSLDIYGEAGKKLKTELYALGSVIADVRLYEFYIAVEWKLMVEDSHNESVVNQICARTVDLLSEIFEWGPQPREATIRDLDELSQVRAREFPGQLMWRLGV